MFGPCCLRHGTRRLASGASGASAKDVQMDEQSDSRGNANQISLILLLRAGSRREVDRNGAPERIRTSDLCLRRATLYPAELRAL